MVNKMTLQIYEVIKKAASQNKKADKISILKQNETFALKSVLQGTYNPNIKLDLPEGDHRILPINHKVHHLVY